MIQINNLTKIYPGNVQALRSLSLEIGVVESAEVGVGQSTRGRDQGRDPADEAVGEAELIPFQPSGETGFPAMDTIGHGADRHAACVLVIKLAHPKDGTERVVVQAIALHVQHIERPIVIRDAGGTGVERVAAGSAESATIGPA